MARVARVIHPGFAYHITHRGNRREPVFLLAEDRASYLSLLALYARRYGVELWAYCLMTNHIHLLAVGREENSLADTIGRAHMRYARLFNLRCGWTGHLWANRFYSTPLDTPHLWRAVKYVELNPVRAGMVARAEDYPWSSAHVHCGLHAEPDPVLSPARPFPGSVPDWSAWLARGLPQEEADQIRRNTLTGRPCGSPAFVERMEAFLGRILRPTKRGPKPERDRQVESPGQTQLWEEAGPIS